MTPPVLHQAGMAGSLGGESYEYRHDVCGIDGVCQAAIHVDDCGRVIRGHLYCYGSFPDFEGGKLCADIQCP